MSHNRIYILLILVSTLFLSVQESQACSRLQPQHRTNPHFLKKHAKASQSIRDMLINLDEDKDEDQTSSKRSKSRLNKAVLINDIKPGLISQTASFINLRGVASVYKKDHPQENFLYSKTSISISIRCLRI